ncbi:hypothetical protein PT274_01880 [Leuconostocaceae bacterium ESL0958]|nr:hypothetical protein [Leuconostocaceae bacterium ESL0958]
MLIIHHIKSSALRNFGQRDSQEWPDLTLPIAAQQKQQDLLAAVIEAYDLGQVISQTQVSNQRVLKATVEKDGQQYQLTAKIREEEDD